MNCPLDHPLDIAFVLGCARSGTSILGELIGSHPDVRYKHEAHAVWRKAGGGESGSHRLTELHATDYVRRKIRKRFRREKGEARLLVEKCPRSALRIPFLRAVFPEAKLIHIVRDGRDVACSLMPGIGGAQWRHLKPPAWKRYQEEMSGVERCAAVWKDVIEVALEDLEGTPHLQLRYEDLLVSPEATADAILKFLGLERHEDVQKFAQRISNKTEQSYQPEKQKKWFQPNHTVRIGRWRENMTADEIDVVDDMLRPLLEKLGYPPAVDAAPGTVREYT